MSERPDEQLVAMSKQADKLAGEGKYLEAIDLAQQVRDIALKYTNSDHPAYGLALGRLAGIYRDAERHQDAARCYRECIEIWHKSAPNYDSILAQSLNNLAEIYLTTGDLTAASPVCREALNTWVTVSGARGKGFAESLSQIATLHYFLGNYAAARSFFKQSVDAWGPRLSPEDLPAYAEIRNNQASLYLAIGDYKSAMESYNEVKTILENLEGSEKNPVLAGVLNNLSQLHKILGKYQDAEQLLGMALSIWKEDQASIIDYAKGLNNWAELKREQGVYGGLDQFYIRAIDIEEKILGKESLDLATSLNNLAMLYWDIGQYKESEGLFERSIRIMESASGKNSTNLALTLDSLASVQLAMGKEKAAIENMVRAAEIDDYLILQVLSVSSERQRMDYIDSIRLRVDGLLSASFFHSSIPGLVEKAMDLVLRRKAILAEVAAVQLDAVLTGRYKSLEPKLAELRDLRTQIARKALAGPGPEGLVTHEKTLADWNRLKENIEADLASSVPELRANISEVQASCKSVAQALPEGAVLVEFFRLRPFDFNAVPSRGDSRWMPARYLAFILKARRPDDVHLVDLGDAITIDNLVFQFRGMMASALCDFSNPNKQIELIGTNLRTKSFDPIIDAIKHQDAFKDKYKLFIAPDGDLTQLPFESLPFENDLCIIDKFHISYLSSGRDLLRFETRPESPQSNPIVVASPDFDLKYPKKTPESASLVSGQSCSLNPRKIHFSPLPGTMNEGSVISSILNIQPWIGIDALKGRVKGARSPSILHIATHGFFLEDLVSNKARGSASQYGRFSGPGMENPLLRSGLALAGANSWLMGDNLPIEAEDGILNAEEVSGMDLFSTDLVVLSACNTGIGAVKVGEGVLGLRRAFVLAGARTLVMSLWKVHDDNTCKLMEDFYDRILDGQPKADALRDAQLALKAKFPHPACWGAFICQGDPGKLRLIGGTRSPVAV